MQKTTYLRLILWILCVPQPGLAQLPGDFRSHQNGPWNLTSTWERFDGSTWVFPAPVTPTGAAGKITVMAPHSLSVSSSLTVDDVIIDSGASLTIAAARILTLSGTAGMIVSGNLIVSGTLTTMTQPTVVKSGGVLIRQQGGAINSTVSTLLFEGGSHFRHEATAPSTALTAATFDSSSTLWITGFAGGGTMTSPNWGLPLGNVVVDCPNMGSGTVNCAGMLKQVKGKLEVLNTGSTGRLILNSTGQSTAANFQQIQIDQQFHIGASAKVLLTTTGSVEVWVGGDWLFDPSSSNAVSQCATSGYGSLEIHGDAYWKSGAFDLASVSGGWGRLQFSGNVTTTGATLLKTGGVSSRATVLFVGAGSPQIWDPAGMADCPYVLDINNEAGVEAVSPLTIDDTLKLTRGVFSFRESLTLNKAIVQSNGSLGSSGGGKSGLIISGSGIVPSDLAIQSGSRFSKFEVGRANASVQSASSFEMDGTFSVTAGEWISKGQIDFLGKSAIAGGGKMRFGSINIHPNGSIDASADFGVDSQLTNDGRFVASAGTINISGDSVVWDGRGDTTFLYQITVDSAHRLYAHLPLSVGRALVVNGFANFGAPLFAQGTINLPAGGVILQGDSCHVSGTLTVSSGGQWMGSPQAQLGLSANLSVNGTLVSQNKIAFDGITVISGTGPKTFRNVEVKGQVTPNSACTIEGDLTIWPGGQLNPGNNGTTFSGNPSTVRSLTGSEVMFNRLSTLAGSAFVTQSPVRIASTTSIRGLWTVWDDVMIEGTLRAFSGLGDIRCQSGKFSVQSTITISSGAFLVAYDSAKLEIGGNLSVTGILDAKGLTTFNGATLMTGSGTKNFSSVVVEGSLTPNAAWTLTQDLTITGSLMAGTGIANFSGFTRIDGKGEIGLNHVNVVSGAQLIASSGAMHIQGNLMIAGEFFANKGKLIFDGMSTKVISCGGSADLYDLTLEDGLAGIDLVAECDVRCGGVVQLNGASFFDADGASNDKHLTLLSRGDEPTDDASIGPLSDSAMIEGNLMAQRWMTGEGRIYRYLSSPLVGTSVATWKKYFPITGKFKDPSGQALICGRTVSPSSPSLYYYDEPGKKYVNYPQSGVAGENPIEVGRGYAAFIRTCDQPTVVTHEGTLVSGINRGMVHLPVTQTGSITTFNNLVANPFPSAIRWDSVHLSNVSPVLAIRDNGTGRFRYYVQGSGLDNDIPNGVIALGQAFWVRTTGENPNVQVTENAKCASASSQGNSFFRQRTGNHLLMSLLQNNQQLDHALLMIHEGSGVLSGLDALDAPKMNNQQDDPLLDLPDLFTLSEDQQALAVNTVPHVPCDAIPLVVRDVIKGEFEIRFESHGDFTSLEIYVDDLYLNKRRRVDETGSYSFQITDDAESRKQSRFVLSFQEKAIVQLPELLLPKSVCGNDSAEVILNRASDHVSYTLSVGDSSLSKKEAGEESFIRWVIPSSNLQDGENEISIHVAGVCSAQLYNRQWKLIKWAFPVFHVRDTTLPGPGRISLEATGGHDDWSFCWYRSADDTLVISHFARFQTAVDSSTSYFVSLRTIDLNCETPRKKVNVGVQHMAVDSVHSWQLFPNPTNGRVWIHLGADDLPMSEASAVDVSGAMMKLNFSLRPNGSYVLETADLQSGFYLIRIRISRGESWFRLIRE